MSKEWLHQILLHANPAIIEQIDARIGRASRSKFIRDAINEYLAEGRIEIREEEKKRISEAGLVQYSVYITRRQAEELDRLASKYGASRNYLIRQAIERKLKKEESKND